MRSASQSLQLIIDSCKAMKNNEAHESALSTNKPWVSAQSTKIKRDAPDHLPIEGDAPESFFSLTERTLHNVASVLLARRGRMESGSHVIKAPLGSQEHAARKRAVLNEVDVSPIEVAFLYDYTNERSVKEMRIRNGLDENSGRPLTDSQRPILSNPKRARR